MDPAWRENTFSFCPDLRAATCKHYKTPRLNNHRFSMLILFCFDFNAHPPYMPFQPALWLSLCLSLLACNASWVELWSKHQDKQKAMEKPQSKRLFTHQKEKKKKNWGVQLLTSFHPLLSAFSNSQVSSHMNKWKGAPNTNVRRNNRKIRIDCVLQMRCESVWFQLIIIEILLHLLHMTGDFFYAVLLVLTLLYLLYYK